MKRNRLEAPVQISDQLDFGSFPGLPELSCFLLCFSREEWWQSPFPFNSSQACWKEPLVYVLFFMPVRSWDEILSINHKAYYYFKYLHLPGEGTCWLPAGKINGVSFLAGTLSLGKNKKKTQIFLFCLLQKMCPDLVKQSTNFRGVTCPTFRATQIGFLFVYFLVQKNKLWTHKGEDIRLLMKCIF